MSFKDFMKKALELNDSKLSKNFNIFLISVIVISIAALILQTVPELAQYNTLFIWVEWISVTIFTIEYILRIYVAKRKKDYIFSFYGVIDLLAILPTLLLLSNLIFLKTGRVARIIRLLRIIRLAKIKVHLKKHERNRDDVLKISIYIYLITLILTGTLLGSLLYVFEFGNPAVPHIPSAMLQIFEIILGVPPNPAIESLGARITILIARFTSFALLGLLIHMLGNIFNKYLLGNKN